MKLEVLHNASLSDLSSIVLFLNRFKKTEIKTQLIFELICHLILPWRRGWSSTGRARGCRWGWGRRSRSWSTGSGVSCAWARSRRPGCPRCRRPRGIWAGSTGISPSCRRGWWPRQTNVIAISNTQQKTIIISITVFSRLYGHKTCFFFY